MYDFVGYDQGSQAGTGAGKQEQGSWAERGHGRLQGRADSREAHTHSPPQHTESCVFLEPCLLMLSTNAARGPAAYLKSERAGGQQRQRGVKQLGQERLTWLVPAVEHAAGSGASVHATEDGQTALPLCMQRRMDRQRCLCACNEGWPDSVASVHVMPER